MPVAVAVAHLNLQPHLDLPWTTQDLLPLLLDPSPGLAVGAAANTLVYIAGIRVLLAGLTWQGVASSWVLGSLTYAAFGLGGYAIVCAYFIVGSLVGCRAGWRSSSGAGWRQGLSSSCIPCCWQVQSRRFACCCFSVMPGQVPVSTGPKQL